MFFRTSSNRLTINPENTSVPMGAHWNSNAVTTPKLPQPPRTAPKRSGFSLESAMITGKYDTTAEATGKVCDLVNVKYGLAAG
jgi:hypothetical protein